MTDLPEKNSSHSSDLSGTKNLSGTKDLTDTKDLVKLVATKLSSQALLFGLAITVILVGGWGLFGPQAILPTVTILFVFLVAMAAYLFQEEKRKGTTGAEEKRPEKPLEVSNGKPSETTIQTARNDSAGFSIQLWTTPAGENPAGSRDIAVIPAKKEAAYRIGEKINIHFGVSRDCYLTLVNIGTSGKVTILFPNGLHRDNRVRAGEHHEIPGKEYGFEYALQGPPGVEKLRAVATLEKIDLLESHFAPDGGLFRTVSPMAGARDIAVIEKKVETMPAGAWAEASWEFQLNG
ncbi:MAG: DUF4384 domain-containing protein [Candidatus Manganitrophaceae bacterium]